MRYTIIQETEDGHTKCLCADKEVPDTQELCPVIFGTIPNPGTTWRVWIVNNSVRKLSAIYYMTRTQLFPSDEQGEMHILRHDAAGYSAVAERWLRRYTTDTRIARAPIPDRVQALIS